MRKLFLFMMTSLDGYFEGPNHDISWHNAKNEEFRRLSGENLVKSDAILMGKRTYELMAGFWPTPRAYKMDPETAAFMNDTPKYVATHKQFDPGWKNVTVIHRDVARRVLAIKKQRGGEIALLGSNRLCTSLMAKGLVDEFRIMVNPVALGAGTPLFEGLEKRSGLRLARVREFKSGNVMLTYLKK
jgi:dihydrofolate reductase